jgi:hypothetical protein
MIRESFVQWVGLSSWSVVRIMMIRHDAKKT